MTPLDVLGPDDRSLDDWLTDWSGDEPTAPTPNLAERNAS